MPRLVDSIHAERPAEVLDKGRAACRGDAPARCLEKLIRLRVDRCYRDNGASRLVRTLAPTVAHQKLATSLSANSLPRSGFRQRLVFRFSTVQSSAPSASSAKILAGCATFVRGNRRRSITCILRSDRLRRILYIFARANRSVGRWPFIFGKPYRWPSQRPFAVYRKVPFYVHPAEILSFGCGSVLAPSRCSGSTTRAVTPCCNFFDCERNNGIFAGTRRHSLAGVA